MIERSQSSLPQLHRLARVVHITAVIYHTSNDMHVFSAWKLRALRFGADIRNISHVVCVR